MFFEPKPGYIKMNDINFESEELTYKKARPHGVHQKVNNFKPKKFLKSLITNDEITKLKEKMKLIIEMEKNGSI